jgi:hypothetical protein
MIKMREIKIVGDSTNSKPFVIVEYLRRENHYVGHKILSRFETEKEAQLELKKLSQSEVKE